MSDFKAKYKQKGLTFGNPERSRISRAEERDERRKKVRAQNFSRLRPLTETAITQTPGKSAATTSRNEKLEKWKQEKEMKKKTEKKVVKPPFKVGVVHHRVFSPPLSNSAGTSCSHSHSHSSIRTRVQQQTAPVKRITRVTEKRLAAKAAARAAAKAASKKSFAPPNYQFKAPAGLPNIPLFGRVKKGSIDATKVSWNLNNDKLNTIKSEPRNSSGSQRKKSNSLMRESPRRSKKFKTSHKESSTSNTQKEAEPRLSSSHKRQASDSSIDSISLRVSSSDPEVFDDLIAESSLINTEMPKKESTLKETVLSSIQPAEVNQISSPGDKEESPLKLPVFSTSGEKDLYSSVTENKESSPLKQNLESDSEPDSEINPSQSQEKDPSKVEVDSLQKADGAPDIISASDSEKMDISFSEPFEKSFNDSLNLALFSPYVVTRRGKKEARREQQIRRGFGHSPEEIPTKETIMQSLNISIEEEKRTSQYFKCLLESETNRLNKQCDLWNNIVASENPPEEAKAIVEQAVGQTKLLLRSKFKQFAGLVLQCEEGAGEHLVTCKDLQGFWDMMSMAVKNCESRFQKLEELKNREWKEEDEMEKSGLKKILAKKSHLKKKSPTKKKSPSKKAPAKSSLREMILAARQKKKEMKENLEVKPTDEDIVEIWKNVVRDSPTKVTSSKCKSSITPQRTTPKERRMNFPFAAMAISQKCKTPEDKGLESKITLETQNEIETKMETEMDTDSDIEIINVQVLLDQSISYINSKQTPGKSILKQIKVESNSDASDDSRSAKSTQKVNFNDNVELNELEVDKEAKTKASLAAGLARIDSGEFDEFDNRESIPEASKKLNFEDESFNEALNASLKEDTVFSGEETTHKTMIPEFNLIPPTPKSPRLRKKGKVASELENSILEETVVEDEELTFTKSLRNRTIVGSLTPRSAKKLNENNFNSTSRGKSPKIRKNNSIISDEESTNEKQLAEIFFQDDTKTEILSLNSSLNHSLRSSRKTSKSPRLQKSSRQVKPKKQAPKPP